MDLIDLQPRMFQQAVEYGITPGFDGQGHGPAATTLAQRIQPAVQGFGAGGQLAGFNRRLRADLPGEGVLLLAPVQSDQGRIVFGLHVVWGCGPGLQFISFRGVVTPVAEYAWPNPIAVRPRSKLRLCFLRKRFRMFVPRPGSKLSIRPALPKAALAARGAELFTKSPSGTQPPLRVRAGFLRGLDE